MIKFLFMCIALSPFGVAGADLKRFQYYKDATAKGEPHGISVITLDGEVYGSASSLFSGLRIINEANQEIPFALRHEFLKDVKKRQVSFPGTIENLKKFKNTVIITVKQKDKPKPVDIIRLKTPSKNFEKKISIACGNDNKSWRTIIKGEAVFDYSAIIPLRRTNVRIPESNYKYFRIIINNFTEEKDSPIHTLVREKQSGVDAKEISAVVKRKTHIKIAGVELVNISRTRTNSSLKKRKYPVKISGILTKDKKTVIKLTCSAEPLTELTLSTSSVNFSRNVRLEASGDNKNWVKKASTKWTKSNIFKQAVNDAGINFPEARHKFYKITISNGDNPELQDIKVTARGNIYRLIMLGKHGKGLKLYYGGSAPYPQYEVARLLPDTIDAAETEYELSRAKLNPLFDGFLQKTDDFKWVFTVCIVVIAAVLVLILYKNLGKLDSPGETENKAE